MNKVERNYCAKYAEIRLKILIFYVLRVRKYTC